MVNLRRNPCQLVIGKRFMIERSRAVSPDWAIFEKNWEQINLQNKPKYLVTFWAI